MDDVPHWSDLAGFYDAMEAQNASMADPGNIGRFVRGEGPAHAAFMLIGERPGDREDREGRPFVGPAGMMLDACLHNAGIDRSQVYTTNAIKNFRFVQRGKRRLHQTPNASEIDHAKWWLAREVMLIQPRVAVTLGVTALRVLTGERTLSAVRGKTLSSENVLVVPTIHPSFLLRMPDPDARERGRAEFVEDLQRAVALARGD